MGQSKPKDLDEFTFTAQVVVDEFPKFPLYIRGDIPTHKLEEFSAWVQKAVEYITQRGEK